MNIVYCGASIGYHEVFVKAAKSLVDGLQKMTIH